MIDLYAEAKLPRWDKINKKMKDAIVKSARENVKLMRADAKMSVPVESGALKKTLRYSVRRKKYGMNAQLIAGRKAAVRYAKVVEYGGRIGRGPDPHAGKHPTRVHKRQQAKPYMWPAVNKYKEKMIRDIGKYASSSWRRR